MSYNIETMLVSTLLYLTKTGIDTDIASLKHQGAKNNQKGIIVFNFMKSGQELHAVPGYLRVNEFHSNEDVEYLFFFSLYIISFTWF